MEISMKDHLMKKYKRMDGAYHFLEIKIGFILVGIKTIRDKEIGCH